MNLNRIRYFIAVAEELHFGRAAARVNVVQPAISQQVRLLESELGLELFERAPRKVVLTDAGEAFLREARRIIQQVTLATQAARDAANGTIGQLTIGFVDNAIWSPLPQLIRAYRTQYPLVDLNLVQRHRSEQLLALQEGRIDVAIVPAPTLLNDMRIQTLMRKPLYVVLPLDHPLCDHVEIDIRLLANEPFVALPMADDPKRINEIVNALCAEAGFVPIMGQPVDQLHTALSLVSAGLGVSIVPNWMSQAWTENVAYRRLKPHSDYILELVTSNVRVRTLVTNFLDIASRYHLTHPTDPAIT